jgi:hypothetical protein
MAELVWTSLVLERDGCSPAKPCLLLVYSAEGRGIPALQPLR